MRLLLIVLLSFVSYSLAGNPFGSFCYKCTEFNRYGQGFINHPNITMCCYYYECWKFDGATTLTGYMRTCPPGTWYNDVPGIGGAPCTAIKPYDECVDVCGEGDTVTPTTCHLYPNPANARQFGTLNPPPDGPWEYTGECGEGFVFDHGSCTCISDPKSCFCMANIMLENDLEDHSCHRGDVVNSENPVTLVAAPGLPTGSAGLFTGPDNPNHLNMPMFSGVYEGCHVNCLSVGVFFNTDRVDQDPAAIVMYGDCFFGPSYGLFLENDAIVAMLSGETVSLAGIPTNQWIYASMVYRRKRNRGILTVSLMNVAQAVECETNCNCNYEAHRTIVIDPLCIPPKSCGLEVGTSGVIGDFFQGQIGRVQVSHTCNPMACSGGHCLTKGKRGRKGRGGG